MRKSSLLPCVLSWTAAATVAAEELDSVDEPNCPICFGGETPSNTTASFRTTNNPSEALQSCGQDHIWHPTGTPFTLASQTSRRQCSNAQARAYPACGCPFRPEVVLVEECHPSCATCRGKGAADCLTCKDGSEVTVDEWWKDGYPEFGFCGAACSLCFGGATPFKPEANVTGWDGRVVYSCSQEYTSDTLALESRDCLADQVDTYRVCGCPELPPPPAPPRGKSPCTLCSDGSEPTNPNATVLYRNYQEVTCGRLSDSFSHSFGSIYPELDSMKCVNSQNEYYADCGCPKPEPSPNACLVCSDGTQIHQNYSSIVIADEIKEIYDESRYYHGVSPENLTCGDLQEWLPFQHIGRDEKMCSTLQYAAHTLCGCPRPDPHPNSCTLCHNRTPISQEYSGVRLVRENATCGQLQDFLLFQETPYDSLKCTSYQHAFYKECGCSKPEPPPDACTLCSDGTPLSQWYSGAAIPNGYHPYKKYMHNGPSVWGYERPIYGWQDTLTCGVLQELLLFDFHAWYGSIHCKKEYQEVADTYCGCNTLPMLAPTEVDAPTNVPLPLYVSVDSPKPFRSSSNSHGSVGVFWHVLTILLVAISLLQW